MRRSRARPLRWAWALALILSAPAVVQAIDPSSELLRRECSNRLGRNDVTLFENGTIRWREWQDGRLAMRLAEVGRDDVEAYVRRLAAADLTEVRESPGGVVGDWVERCALTLSLPGTSPRAFEYGRLDTHPLALADLLRIADELAVRAQEAPVAGGLPSEYTPRSGDRLLRIDDLEFEVVGRTADGNGFEVRGTVQPLSMYLTLDDLRRQFVRVLHRGPVK